MIAGRWEGFMTVPAVSILATNGAGGPTAVAITPGRYTISSLCAHLQAQLIALRPPATGTWTVTLSIGSSGTGRVTIQCTQAAGTWAITWTSTELRDILGFTANSGPTNQPDTGPKQARGLWFPASTIQCAGDPARAPKGSDERRTVSPRGAVLSRVGNTFYRHKALGYTHVPQARAWEAAAVAAGLPANSGWDTFYNETQLGQSSSWFTPASAVKIYYDVQGVDTVVGADLNAGAGPTAGWQLLNPPTLDDLKNSQAQWTGYVALPIGDISSTG
jgi:hypothetical protein